METENTQPNAPATEPDVSQETQSPAQPSQEAILAEFNAASSEGRPYQPPKPQAYEEKLKEAKGGDYKPPEERAVKFADPNPQMEAAKKSFDQIMGKITELGEFLKTANENSAEGLQAKMRLEALEFQAKENSERFAGMLKQEFAAALSADKTFREQHSHYSDYLAKLDGGEFANAVLNDNGRIQILASLYKWLDQPGHFQQFMAASKEARLAGLKNFSAAASYADRLPQAPQAPQIAPPPAPALPASIKPPKDAPGEGVDGGSYDPADQDAVYKRFFPKAGR